MLQQMRSGASSTFLKYIFFTLLMAGTVGLALFGVQDVFRHGFHTETVASIGHDSISKPELDQMVMEALRNKGITREDAYRQGIPLETLEREINSRILLRAAADMGIVIDDATVRRKINSLLEPMVAKGLTEKDALENVLNTFGQSEGSLVATLKAELAVESLTHAIADGAAAPPEMVNDFMRYRNEWRRGDYIRLTAADADMKEPTDEDLKEFYKGAMTLHYMQPEMRKFSVLVLSPDSLPGAQKPMDPKAFYDQHKTDFTSPEKRVISVISVGDEALAKSLYAKASAKRDLKGLALEAGKDKVQYVSDTYTVDTFIPEELATDAFKAPAGSVVGPAKGALGRSFIARVEKIIPPSVKSFDEVKPQIEKILAGQNTGANSEALYNRANEIDEMIGGGKTLADVAQHYNLKTIDFDALDAHGLDAAGKKTDPHGIADFDNVLKTAFSLDKGMASQPAQLKTGEFFFVEVHDIQPAQAKPFESVRADVLSAWKDKQVGMALDAKADKIMQRLHMGETLEKVAGDANKQIQHTALVQRNAGQQKNAQVEPGVTLALFSIDDTGQSTAVPGPGSVTILRLAERKVDATKPPTKEEVDSMQSMLAQSMQTDLLEEFRRTLLTKYKVSIDHDAIKQMYAPQEGAAEDAQ